MRKKIFTILLALAASVGMSWATDPIVIATNTGQSSYTQGTITVSVGEVGDNDGFYLNDDKPASISNSGSSTISKIELVPGWFLNKHSYVRANGAEPNSSSEELITFLNVNSNEVTISCSVAIYIKEVRIYFEEPQLAVANTLQLHVNDAEMGSVAVTNLLGSDIVDNGDGTYTVPEGAEVTLLATPNEGYEFSGWKASQTICDFAECEFIALKTVDNPLTFDMYAEAAFLAEFKASAPQPTVWTSLAVGDVIKLGDKIEVPAEGDGSWGINGNVLRNAWGPYTLIRANIVQASESDDPEVTETEDGAFYVFKAENDNFYPLSNIAKGGGLVVTTTSDGLEVTNVGDLGMPVFTVAVHDNGGTTAIDQLENGKCENVKMIIDGQLLIIRDGRTYTLTGQQVR